MILAAFQEDGISIPESIPLDRRFIYELQISKLALYKSFGIRSGLGAREGIQEEMASVVSFKETQVTQHYKDYSHPKIANSRLGPRHSEWYTNY